MFTDIHNCCMLLGTADDILILCHKSPDGDTIGAAYGLYHALTQLAAGQRCGVPIRCPEKFAYIHGGIEMPEFEPQLIIAVDIAGPGLLGPALEQYADRVDLCIDHHVSNSDYAGLTLLDAQAAAACEVMTSVIRHLGVPLTKPMADALFTGCATDTGCFRYSNTTANTLRTAADLIDAGADSARITNDLFETVSRKRMTLENRIMDTLEYHFDDRCATIVMSRPCSMSWAPRWKIWRASCPFPGALRAWMWRWPSGRIPRGTYKISVRTGEKANASAICENFGGGGHVRAAGCNVPGPLEHAKELLLEAVRKELTAHERWNHLHRQTRRAHLL